MNNQNSNIKGTKTSTAEIQKRIEIAESLFGSVPNLLTLEEALNERFSTNLPAKD